MFDKEAIIALQEHASINAANVALAGTHETKELAALPSDYTLHNLEPYLPLRRRARGTMTTAILAAFTGYTVAHAETGASAFINPESMAATAVLNLGTPTAPGHADNLAKLQLKKTAAYSALTAVATGAGLKQSTAAEFLEDWPEHLKCFNDAGEIALPKAIAAMRKLTIESMRKLESSEQQLSASRSAFESVQATSVEPIPTTIYFECQPYSDLPRRMFVLRLGVQTGDTKPCITLRIVKAEQHAEEMANELGELIAVQFNGKEIPVMLGSYSKS